MKQSRHLINRRDFLRRGAGVVATISMVRSSVLGLRGQTPPSNKLNIGCIGVAGRGGDDINELRSENIVALCDVDWKHAAPTFEKYPDAKRFKDFRRMFDAMANEMDAVLVATPDHTHAPAALRAMKLGKHVFCEKPMAHSMAEVRAMMAAARDNKVVTQLGNQGHSFDSIRNFCEWIWDGAIGTVREVQAFCASNYGRIRQLERLSETHAAPDTLDWDLWLGPTPYRPYNPVFLPGRWRGWSQFGTGVLGDWTCHVIDPMFWALDLGAPTHIEAETFEYDPKVHFETFPHETIIRYDFPARGNRPAVKLTWYDGRQRPPRPEELEEGVKIPDIGAFVIGDKGKIMYGSHGAGGLQIIPSEKMAEYKKRLPARSLPRSPGYHKEWIKAVKEGKRAGSDFSYGGPLTEIALLGIIAIRMKGTRLEWDSAAMRFTNSPEANELLAHPHREGWMA
ncbi:MAG: Gfo/Idh/MocA family protein [Verrucomicrobiia bacterium]